MPLPPPTKPNDVFRRSPCDAVPALRPFLGPSRHSASPAELRMPWAFRAELPKLLAGPFRVPFPGSVSVRRVPWRVVDPRGGKRVDVVVLGGR